MGQLSKKIILFSVIMLSAVLAFFGCGKDVYEDMTLKLNTYEQTISLSDDQSENTFTIVSTVSDAPKDYNGAVTFTITNPTGSIALVETSSVSDGVTSAVFSASGVGNSIITVTTKEGNLQKRVNVTVIREIEEVSFTNTTLPLPRATTINVANYLTFTPNDTSQTAVTISLALPTGITAGQEELDKVQINGTTILVPADADIDEFILLATSNINNELVAQANVMVVNGIDPSTIGIYVDNNTPNNTADDVELTKTSGVFALELAKNTSDLSTKRVYFNFNNDTALNSAYVAVLNSFDSAVVQVDKITTFNNTFDIKSIGEGVQTLTFVIKHASYPGFTSLYQTVTLNVNVVSYPNEITLSNPDTSSELSMISVYDAYSGSTRYGTALKLTISDQAGERYNQYAVFSLSDPTNDRVVLRDQYGVIIEYGDLVQTGTTVYLKHNYTDEENAPGDLDLIVTSNTYQDTQTTLPIHFVRGQVSLLVQENTLKINKSDNLGVGYEYGMAEVVFTNLEESFDRSTLLVTVADSTLVKVEKTAGTIAFVGLGVTGTTTATISAPNGSEVTITIIVFEALSAENTSVHIAGQTLYNVEEDISIADLRNTYYFSIKNSLSLPISLVINGTAHSTVPTDLNVFTVARDLDEDTVTTYALIVKTVSATQIATQNHAGESVITINVRGYGAEGLQNQVLVFKFILNVEIPISSISTNASETTVYDINSLSSTQSANYGSHTITLNTNPYSASYNYEDITWSMIYGTAVYVGTKTISGNTVSYRFVLGNSSSYVTLVTDKLNYKQATVTVSLASTSASSEIFSIMAVINQTYYNEIGNEISSRQETRVKFTAKKPDKVQDIVFGNVLNQTITFDARDLEYSGSVFTAPIEDRTKNVEFTVLPSTALTKDLAVSYSGTDISVSVDNINKIISVVVDTKSSTGDVIEIQVYTLDSVYGSDQYSTYATLYVEILDGSSEALAYQISTAADLASIDQYMNAYYVLTNNINLSGSNWKPLGVEMVNDQETVTEFTGSLNGGYTVDGKTYYYSINGLTISNNSTILPYNHTGLFGVIGNAGIVKNITFNNVSIVINDNANNADNFVFAGVVAGYNKGIIENNVINDGNAISNSFASNIFRLNSANYSDSLSSYTYGIRFTSAASSDAHFIALGGVVGLNQNELTNNIVNSILINFSDTSNTTVYAGGLAGINDTKVNGTENAIITKTLEAGTNLVATSFDVVSAINIDETLTVLNANSAIG